MSSDRSHILKQTCSWKLQFCLSMCDLLVDIRHERVKESLRRVECKWTKINTKYLWISRYIKLYKQWCIDQNFSLAARKEEGTCKSFTHLNVRLDYVRYISIVQEERTSNWILHVSATKPIVNLFPAKNYVKSCRLYHYIFSLYQIQNKFNT